MEILLKASDVGQWHPVTFYSRKMKPAETRYETHDQELRIGAIIWKVASTRSLLSPITTTFAALWIPAFMDTKSLSSRQFRWAQELSTYHFRIDYRQGKANATAAALSRFLQRSQAGEEALRAENSQILHLLRSLLTNARLA